MEETKQEVSGEATVEVKQEEIKEQSLVKVHESGIKYFAIPLKAESGETMELRLFDTFSLSRLEFETRDEFIVRRKMLNNQNKALLKGKFCWYSKNVEDLKRGNNKTSWGTLTPAKARLFLEQLKQKQSGNQDS